MKLATKNTTRHKKEIGFSCFCVLCGQPIGSLSRVYGTDGENHTDRAGWLILNRAAKNQRDYQLNRVEAWMLPKELTAVRFCGCIARRGSVFVIVSVGLALQDF